MGLAISPCPTLLPMLVVVFAGFGRGGSIEDWDMTRSE